jgi:uncharacterized protein
LDALFLSNITSPPLLFFMLGAAATLVRSDLEIPEQVAKFLSLYLLFAIGFKGGVALAESPLDFEVAKGLLTALLMASVVPVYVFYLLRRKMSTADAAATAATYGSISAVTFVTCTSYLDANGVAWSGHLVAAMALMESPAIIIGLLLYRIYQSKEERDQPELMAPGELMRESFLNGSVFLIMGSLIIGWISGPVGKAQISPLVNDLFIGVLCLFLLDMGIVAMRRLQDMRSAERGLGSLGMIAWGIALPLLNASIAVGLAVLIDLPEGDAVLLIVLCASASYIAVPAAMRLALPEANPSVYLALSLAVTFPFNLLIGIPLYHQAVNWLA